MTVSEFHNDEVLAESRRRFLQRLEPLRARLHRYCERILGSPLDAEDVVQEVLAEVFFRGPIHDHQDGLENWAFRVAHNRAMDVLRRRAVRQRPLEPAATATAPIDPVVARQSARDAFAHLVRHLPPKERASLVFKDVLDYSLRETAAELGSTEGAVKAALHRARAKLRALAEVPIGPPVTADVAPPDAEELQLVTQYAARFNARDWDGLAAQLRADAALRVVDVFDGSGTAPFERHYFRNYSRMQVELELRPVVLSGEPVILVERRIDGRPHLYSVVRVAFDGVRIASITDYLHVPTYLLDAIATQIDCGPPAGFEWDHLGPSRGFPTPP